MTATAYTLAGVIAAAIIFIGAHFILAPRGVLVRLMVWVSRRTMGADK